MSDLKFIGVTDERDACDCCGKTNLKRVVVFEDSEGQFQFRGTSCALKTSKFLRKEIVKKAEKNLDAFKKGKLASWSDSFKAIQKINKVLVK